jgi:hypothetical protein
MSLKLYCAFCKKDSSEDPSTYYRCDREGCENSLCGPCFSASAHMFFPPESEETGSSVCSALCRAGVSFTEKRKYRLFHDGWCACGEKIRNDKKYNDDLRRFARIKFVDDRPPPPIPSSIAHTVRVEGQTVHNLLEFDEELEKYRPRLPSLFDKLDKSDPGYPSFLAKYNALRDRMRMPLI